MKNAIYLIITLLLITYSNISGKDSAPGRNLSNGDSLKILCTPELFSVTNKWAAEFNKLNPAAKIKILSISNTKFSIDLFKNGNLFLVKNEQLAELESESIWKIVVARDVLIPIINSKNPLMSEITKHGISPEAFSRFLSNPLSRSWGTLLANTEEAPANYYCINDNSIIKGISRFLKTDKNISAGKELNSSAEMISAIQKDQYAIGFCKMTDILDYKNMSITENIRLLPIDKNGNGQIDYNEKIFDDFTTFSRGVWIGKYPKTLFSNIYSVSSVQPEKKIELAFIKWILNDGQQYLYENGFSDLLISERQSAIDKLDTAKIYESSSRSSFSLLKIFMILISLVIIVGLIIDGIARLKHRKRAPSQISDPVFRKVLDENSLSVPKGIYYDKTHTWAFMEQNGIVKVGIDDFLQHITGTISRIRMTEKGKMVKKGEQIMSIIQNGKQLNLYAPVSGVIAEQNRILDKDSSIINSSPYLDGWIYKIEPTNWARESQLLFMAEKQKQHIKKEFTRLKDFLSTVLTSDTEKYSAVILQDGGELKDGVLSNLGPEVWEDFQTKFIDPSKQIWFYEIV